MAGSKPAPLKNTRVRHPADYLLEVLKERSSRDLNELATFRDELTPPGRKTSRLRKSQHKRNEDKSAHECVLYKVEA
jgi:hypothetical protein